MVGRVPWARLRQMARLIMEERTEEARDRWEREAFVGWQLRICQPLPCDRRGRPKGRHPSFGSYKRMMGLKGRTTDEKPMKGQEIIDMVLEKAGKAFKHGTVERTLTYPQGTRPRLAPTHRKAR